MSISECVTMDKDFNSGKRMEKSMIKRVSVGHFKRIAAVFFIAFSANVYALNNGSEEQTTDPVQQVRIGDKYFNGIGVLRNRAEGIKWYRKAAEQGNPEAQIRLGRCYLKGVGVPYDSAEGIKWYRKAAEQGNSYAQVKLGGFYMKGRYVKEDKKELVIQRRQN